jgi:hypothetical protein
MPTRLIILKAVRGYGMGTVAGDSGYISNAEFRHDRSSGRFGQLQRAIFLSNNRSTSFAYRDVGKGREHDCKDAGGTTPRMEEVEQCMEQLPRATQELLPRSGSFACLRLVSSHSCRRSLHSTLTTFWQVLWLMPSTLKTAYLRTSLNR